MQYPCKGCYKEWDHDCVCHEWEAWFRAMWQEMRALFGYEDGGKI